MISTKNLENILYNNGINQINNEDKPYNILLIFQYIIKDYINGFFPLILIILLINRKKWKRPVVFILIAHWFLKSTGNALRDTLYLTTPTDELNRNWPYFSKSWLMITLSQTLYIGGEIVGDWYPLIRTKAVIMNKEDLRKVYFTGILFNLSKIVMIMRYYAVYLLDPVDMDNEQVKRFNYKYTIIWYYAFYLFMILCSLGYDLSIMRVMKKKIFDSYKRNSASTGNNNGSKSFFMERFKIMSKIRTVISMTGPVLFLPIVLVYLKFRQGECLNVDDTCSDIPIDGIVYGLSYFVRDISYNLMYIDQILLRFYAERNNPKYRLSTVFSSMHNGFNDNKNGNSFTVNSFQYLNRYSALSYPTKEKMAAASEEEPIDLKTLGNNKNNRTSTTTLVSPFITPSAYRYSALSLSKKDKIMSEDEPFDLATLGNSNRTSTMTLVSPFAMNASNSSNSIPNDMTSSPSKLSFNENATNELTSYTSSTSSSSTSVDISEYFN